MRYSNLPLDSLIPFFLSKGKEGEFWDFKREWHDKIEDLLKDIICFSNTAIDEDCFLIFGVADDLSVVGVSEPRRRQADIIDAISNLVFAGDNLPRITVETIKYQSEDLDILIIHDTDKTPIYLKKQYGKMKSGCVYARVGDRNTPDNDNAEIGVIENLWRKRFGLTKAPIDFIFDALQNDLDWAESTNGYYYRFRPEYTIERLNEDYPEFGRGSDEFYSYAQTNESTSYYMLNVKARGTVLEEFQIVNLDSGRLSIPVPEWGYVHLKEYHQDVVGYKYYIKGNHTEKLMRFMYNPQNADQRWAYSNLEKIVLYYDSEYERQCFEDYVNYYKEELKKRVANSDEYDYIITESDTKTSGYKKSLRVAIVLKEMLEEFRKQDL
jgi:hypothetical protein